GVPSDLAAHSVTAIVWHHVAASFRASNFQLTLYLDGVQVAQGSFATASLGNTAPVDIGRNGGPTGNFWLGKLDDVLIWNAVRTAAQIQANFSNELTTTQTGLVGNWRFDEGSGTTAFDSAGTPQNATLFGGFSWSNLVPDP